MRTLKITIKGILPNPKVEDKKDVDNLMTVFSSAIRYSFKRVLEGKERQEIVELLGEKYNLNTRQAKDAIESARQTIKSQEELVKLNYENFTKKVEAIEKALGGKKLSDKKRKALLSKLDKRKRKQAYYKGFIDAKTIPPVTFGTKEAFIKRCKGLITREQWQSLRNNRVYSRGDKTKQGNPNLRVVIEKGMSFLEISLLQKSKTNRARKIKVPLYLPQKLSKKTGKVNGRDYRQMFLDFLETGEAYQVEMIKKDGKYYVHITFDEDKVRDYKLVHTGHLYTLGVDTNPDGFALTLVDSRGNYKYSTYLKNGGLAYARTDKRENLCGELAKEVALITKNFGCAVAFEDLKFKDDKDVSSKLARTSHQFIYRKLLEMLEISCIREGVEVVKVKPQFTSKIGLFKYCHQHGLAVHNGAAMVIARRSYGFREKIPKILKDKFVKDKEKFNTFSEWKKWSAISKEMLKYEGRVKNPGFYLAYRKYILGLTKVQAS